MSGTFAARHCISRSDIPALSVSPASAYIRDGEILEADIEVNAVDHCWAIFPDGPFPQCSSYIFDLQSVLTHETGHFIGLGHNCWVVPGDFHIDDQGRPTPSCAASVVDGHGEPLSEATMYPYTNPGDVRPRSLAADEKRAACEMYPLWAAPADDWAGGAGCGLAPRSASSPSSRGVGTLLATVVVFATWRRRRSRPTTGIRGSADR